jgi:hypothetical protein
MAATASPAWGLQQGGDPRLATSLTGRTREAVNAIVDSAAREGLPTDPLVIYALEGSRKGAPGDSIVKYVARFVRQMRQARAALGPGSTPLDVQAGATAIRNGVAIKQLERLRAVRNGSRIASALDVLTYLINKGVQADTASNVIVGLVLVSASDDQLQGLTEQVERDIAGGTPAAQAMSARGQGLVSDIAAAQSNNGGAPGGTLPSAMGSTRSADPAANGRLGGTSAQGGAATSQSKPPAPAGRPKKP